MNVEVRETTGSDQFSSTMWSVSGIKLGLVSKYFYLRYFAGPTLFFFFSETESLNGAWWFTRLASKPLKSSWIWEPLSPSTEIADTGPPCWHFQWVLGIWTQVPKLVHCWLSYFPALSGDPQLTHCPLPPAIVTAGGRLTQTTTWRSGGRREQQIENNLWTEI